MDFTNIFDARGNQNLWYEKWQIGGACVSWNTMHKTKRLTIHACQMFLEKCCIFQCDAYRVHTYEKHVKNVSNVKNTEMLLYDLYVYVYIGF